MRTITRDTLGDAHEAMLKAILEEGEQVFITHGDKTEETIEYPEPICVHVERPYRPPMISDCLPFKEGFLQEYVKKVCEITPWRGDGTDAVYTYGNRLRDYPMLDTAIEEEPTNRLDIHGDGRGDGIDQLPIVVEKLVQHPSTRQAIMHTWVPWLDDHSEEPPCLQTAQFLIRGGKLNAVFAFRSHDMHEGWGPNTYALTHLMQRVQWMLLRQEYEVELGWLETVSTSAHIYTRHNPDSLALFRRKVRV
ncbi:MAG: thymidylate synthase [bacterium]